MKLLLSHKSERMKAWKVCAGLRSWRWTAGLRHFPHCMRWYDLWSEMCLSRKLQPADSLLPSARDQASRWSQQRHDVMVFNLAASHLYNRVLFNQDPFSLVHFDLNWRRCESWKLDVCYTSSPAEVAPSLILSNATDMATHPSDWDWNDSIKELEQVTL